MAASLIWRAHRRATLPLIANARQYATTVTESTPNIAAAVLSKGKAPVDDNVYLPLSSLLPREHNEPPPSSRVVSLDPTVFSHPIRRDILHLCAVHYLDGLRQGSASTKTRGEVAGSGRKLRPQKGSGRARLGDAGSPMLRGGGRAFGPKPRDFSTKLPRKVIQMGMRVALSAKLKERHLSVVESLNWRGNKTNELAKRISGLAWGEGVLMVTGERSIPTLLERSSGNIPTVDVIHVEDLTVYGILKAKRLVLDVGAVEWLEEVLSKKTGLIEYLTEEEIEELVKDAPTSEVEFAANP